MIICSMHGFIFSVDDGYFLVMFERLPGWSVRGDYSAAVSLCPCPPEPSFWLNQKAQTVPMLLFIYFRRRQTQGTHSQDSGLCFWTSLGVSPNPPHLLVIQPQAFTRFWPNQMAQTVLPLFLTKPIFWPNQNALTDDVVFFFFQTEPNKPQFTMLVQEILGCFCTKRLSVSWNPSSLLSTQPEPFTTLMK